MLSVRFITSGRTKRSERFRWSGRSESLWRVEDPGVLKGPQYIGCLGRSGSLRAKNKARFQIRSRLRIQISVSKLHLLTPQDL